MDPKTLIAVASIFGYPISALAVWLNITNWKADVVWILAALFWAFKLVRACMKAYQEYKEKEIELQNKRDRYNKDIFS